jgi:hypothetical protein
MLTVIPIHSIPMHFFIIHSSFHSILSEHRNFEENDRFGAEMAPKIHCSEFLKPSVCHFSSLKSYLSQGIVFESKNIATRLEDPYIFAKSRVARTKNCWLQRNDLLKGMTR